MYTTSSQTIGPYLHIGMDWAVDPDFAGPNVQGERIEVAGRIVDGDGAPVVDAMLEVWQANSHGRYAHPEDTRDLPLDDGFTGWGRASTSVQLSGSVQPPPSAARCLPSQAQLITPFICVRKGPPPPDACS